MLDSILPHSQLASSTTSAAHAACRLAVGIGIERPWDLAAAVLADLPAAALAAVAAQPAVPGHVRLTAGPVRHDDGRLVAARIGLLESAGRAGEVRLEWAADVARVRVCDAAGGDLPADGSSTGSVAIDGRVLTLFLRRYEWLHLEVEFC
jgi:hypothetical protein